MYHIIWKGLKGNLKCHLSLFCYKGEMCMLVMTLKWSNLKKLKAFGKLPFVKLLSDAGYVSVTAMKHNSVYTRQK